VEFLSGGKLRRERTRALTKTGNFLGIFCEFLECLEWLEPNHKYFHKLRVLVHYFQRTGTAV
jgi:hypothetical protein